MDEHALLSFHQLPANEARQRHFRAGRLRLHVNIYLHRVVAPAHSDFQALFSGHFLLLRHQHTISPRRVSAKLSAGHFHVAIHI